MQINNNSNKYNPDFTSLNPLKTPLGAFYNKNAVIPTLIIETGVTLGRSFEANKKRGKKDALDRFTEQGASAVVWIWGVQVLKKIGETIGKKILKLENLDFNLGRDILRNPVKNNKIDPKTAGFKAANLLFSTFIATYFIGFMLPKISRNIAEKFSQNDNSKSDSKNDSKNNSTQNEKKSQNEPTGLNSLSFEEFKNKTSKNNPVSFTSLLDKTLSLAHTIENNSTVRLLTTDTGVVTGRCINAPDKFKKIENLFRDISSVYFYLFSTVHSVKLLNKIAKNTDIDPKILSKLTEQLKTIEASSKDEFLESALGSIKDSDKKILDELFGSEKIISLEKFLSKFPDYDSKALKMTELQPVFENKRVLTYLQAQDVLKNGKITDPEFLKETFEFATNGASNDKLKFVSKESLEKMRKSMDEFTRQICNSTDGKITPEIIEKHANKNILKNFAFYSIGTGLSIFALGIVIPKLQYFISEKLSSKKDDSQQ